MTRAEDNDLEKDDCLERRGGDCAENRLKQWRARRIKWGKPERNREKITENKKTLKGLHFE